MTVEEIRASNRERQRAYRARSKSIYDHAVTKALREIGRRFRAEHPDEWRELVARYRAELAGDA